MRLIDADLLRKNMEFICMGIMAGTEPYNAPLTEIDNAPTVAGRPQGEWGKWVISEVQCPNCLEYFPTDCYSIGELDKCPNCGAQMKGDAEE